MRRHKIKRDRNDSRRCAVIIAFETGDVTRVDKIKALDAFGIKISRKANSDRVDAALEKAYRTACDDARRADGLRVARNKRRNQRRRLAA